MSSNIKHTFDCWHDGLISTSEILCRILTSDLPVGERLEHIATVALILNKQEQAEAEADAALLYDDSKDDYELSTVEYYTTVLNAGEHCAHILEHAKYYGF